MNIISNNIKYLRRKYNLTQEEFAKLFGVKRAIIGAYEENRAEPKLDLLFKIASYFQFTIDDIVSKNLEEGTAKTIIDIQKIKGNDRVLSIAVNEDNEEYINFVPQKASAGYTTGLADPEYIAELPKFKLPNLPNGTYRAFEIKGDSMLPVKPNSILIGSYVDDWRTIEDGKTYIIVTLSEGLVYKRVFNTLNKNNSIQCISDNKLYEPFTLTADQILEVWKAKAIISLDIPESQDLEQLQSLRTLSQQLQLKIDELMGKA